MLSQPVAATTVPGPPIAISAASGDTNPVGVDGNQAAQLANGDYLEYPNINFGTGSIGSATFCPRRMGVGR